MAGLELLPQLGVRVTRGLVQSAELLALPGADLDSWVSEQLERLPALEVPAPRTCPRCGGTVWSSGRHACLIGGRRDDVSTGTAQAPNPRVDEALAAVAAVLGAPGRAVAAYLLADLDDRGRLDRSLSSVAAGAGCSRRVVEMVLAHLRAELGAGIAAPDLRTSLLLQLAARPDAPALCAHIVDRCLELLARGDAAGVARRIGATVEQVQAAAQWLRRLDPGSSIGRTPSAAAPVVPDLVVVDLDGRLVVDAADAAWRAARVAPTYAGLAASQPAVRQEVLAASAVLDRLAARGATVVRVAQSVVDSQADYVRGVGPHRAVTRAQVATVLGLHESTVSRAVAGKTAVWPDGRARPLCGLFGPPGRATRDLLLALLAEGPATDRQLACALTERGHPTARRTVAKYRAQLGIPANR